MVSKVTGISPAFPGVSAATTQTSGDVTVLNQGPQTLVIDGYFSEPYIKIDPSGGVWLNDNSPSKAIDNNFSLSTLPSHPEAAIQPPNWVKQDDLGKYTWHDHRAHWMGGAQPPALGNAHPDASHPYLVQNWTIPISVGGTKGVIKGTLTYEPSGHLTTYITWGAIAFVVIGFLYIQFVLQPRRMRAAVAAAKEESTSQP